MVLVDSIRKVYEAIKALVTRRVLIECDRIPYRFDNVPFKKILNWISLEASISLGTNDPWGLPTHLQVEPTACCNLKCALCPITSGISRPTGDMDINLFKRLIDEIGDYIFLILLWDWGEPFINSHIYDMISYAKLKKIKIATSTNGCLFSHVECADKVVRSGLHTLIFAIDGISQKTYERYRQGGDLESALQGIRNVLARKRALNSKTPLVNLRFIAMKHNEHEIPMLKDFARSLGVDMVSIKTLNPYSDNTCGEKGALVDVDEKEFIPKNDRYRRFRYSGGGLRRVRVQNNPCKNLWNMPVMHWNGVICPCTYDYREKIIFGDLSKKTFKNIWYGRPYQQMRRQFRSDWKKIGMCCNCSFAYEGGYSPDEGIKWAFFFNSLDSDKTKVREQ